MGGCEGSGLVVDAVQADFCAALLCLHCGGDYRGRGVLHPRVVNDVLEGWTVGGTQRQAPFDQLLAFWRKKKKKKQSDILFRKTLQLH